MSPCIFLFTLAAISANGTSIFLINWSPFALKSYVAISPISVLRQYGLFLWFSFPCNIAFFSNFIKVLFTPFYRSLKIFSLWLKVILQLTNYLSKLINSWPFKNIVMLCLPKPSQFSSGWLWDYPCPPSPKKKKKRITKYIWCYKIFYRTHYPDWYLRNILKFRIFDKNAERHRL